MRPVALAALLSALLAGCAPSTVDTTPAPTITDACLPPAPSVEAAAPSGTAPRRVPDLTLDCLAGGGKVRLAALHRPAIVNLWASWCGPCRTELPAFQRYASQVGDRVLVLGVDTSDTRDAGAGLLHDTGVDFPSLFDAKGLLLAGVGRSALPVTLFVDAGGGLRYVYNDKALDEAAITRLAGTQLGVGT